MILFFVSKCNLRYLIRLIDSVGFCRKLCCLIKLILGTGNIIASTMDCTLWLMAILLPLVVQKKFRKLMLQVLVNVLHDMQYEEMLKQLISNYEMLVKGLTAVVLIILFVLNWYSNSALTWLYITVILSCIITVIDFALELILTTSNIVYNRIIQTN